ncbi:MAG: deiodinase [Acidobacteria bacterium]|nr:MAG: deiodinase [Acidobacteriota bacterium]
MNRLYERYRDRAAFYVVYIEEAHPVDAWQVDDNVEQKVLFKNPVSGEERSSVAGVCLTKLGIKLPALVDDLKNTAERAYTGWPDRLYVVDRQGRIAFKSPPGPFGFRPAELEKALERVLAK